MNFAIGTMRVSQPAPGRNGVPREYRAVRTGPIPSGRESRHSPFRVDDQKRQQIQDSFSRRAWFSSTVAQFLSESPDAVLGRLAANSDFDVSAEQRDAWIEEIGFLRRNLGGWSGSVFLEFSIPRMGKRADVILLLGGLIVVVEFKVGEKSFDRDDRDQVWDYALDLKNFHAASHESPILPVLVATGATRAAQIVPFADDDGVYRPLLVNEGAFRDSVNAVFNGIRDPALDGPAWSHAVYQPTPTIVEAARALYARHCVEDIARSDSGARNLTRTSRRIEEIADLARVEGRKVICFVTGVPGAGKTLVGLNLATRHSREDEPTHAVYLSGNGPLVAVLREALTRDEFSRRRAAGESVRKGRIGESVKSFIQNVHHFRDDAIVSNDPPFEHVVIFDEAQRAWDKRQTSTFMRTKKKIANFDQSEPEFLISFLDRHSDWAVVICLVGGGQEINTGEAGITAWLEAIRDSFPRWEPHVSSQLNESEYHVGTTVVELERRGNLHHEDDLHLAVSMRSFRAEHVSSFVGALLDCDRNEASARYSDLKGRYPIVISRDLERARGWVRATARGTERFGLLASSKAQRLKPHAIDVRVEIDPIHWFLNDRDDTRSSWYLEDAATEFQVQGLELDWTCVSWDGDLRFNGDAWAYHHFRGKRWCGVHEPRNRTYLLNAYRVLLTRARQGMVLFIPPGNVADPTRTPEMYDRTFEYLVDVGLPVLEG